MYSVESSEVCPSDSAAPPDNLILDMPNSDLLNDLAISNIVSVGTILS